MEKYIFSKKPRLKLKRTMNFLKISDSVCLKIKVLSTECNFFNTKPNIYM